MHMYITRGSVKARVRDRVQVMSAALIGCSCIYTSQEVVLKLRQGPHMNDKDRR